MFRIHRKLPKSTQTMVMYIINVGKMEKQKCRGPNTEYRRVQYLPHKISLPQKASVPSFFSAGITLIKGSLSPLTAYKLLVCHLGRPLFVLCLLMRGRDASR
jgi:hypothetical protein